MLGIMAGMDQESWTRWQLSSLVVFDISVVAGAGSYGLDCSDGH